MSEPARGDDERLTQLIKRVRPKRQETAGEPSQHDESWRPVSRRGRRRSFQVDYGRDGTPRLRET